MQQQLLQFKLTDALFQGVRTSTDPPHNNYNIDLPRSFSVTNPQKVTRSTSRETISHPPEPSLIPFTGNCTPSLLLLQRNTPQSLIPQRSCFSAPLSRWLAGGGGLQLNQTKRLSGVLSPYSLETCREIQWGHSWLHTPPNSTLLSQSSYTETGYTHNPHTRTPLRRVCNET